MRTWQDRLKSRKLWAMVGAVVFSVAALAGFDMPVEEVVLVDSLFAFYVLIEGTIDAVRKHE